MTRRIAAAQALAGQRNMRFAAAIRRRKTRPADALLPKAI